MDGGGGRGEDSGVEWDGVGGSGGEEVGVEEVEDGKWIVEG